MKIITVLLSSVLLLSGCFDVTSQNTPPQIAGGNNSSANTQYRKPIPQNTPYTDYYYYDKYGELTIDVYEMVDCSDYYWVRKFATEVITKGVKNNTPYLVRVLCVEAPDYQYWVKEVKRIQESLK